MSPPPAAPDADPPAPPQRSLYRRLRRAAARRFPGLQARYRATEARLYAWRARFRHWRDWRRGQPRHRWLTTLGWLAASARAIARRRREPRLTVGVDVTPLWEPLAGIGWYLRRLLGELAERHDVCIRLYGPTLAAAPDRPLPVTELPRGPAIEEVLYEVPAHTLPEPGRLMRWLHRAERLLVALDGNDVLFAPNFLLPDRFARARGALVATVHDLGFRRVPWTLRERTRRELADRFQRTALRASRLITVTAAVGDELAAYGYAARERVRVVHHGAGQLEGVAAEPPPAGLPKRFALHVGTLEPRKNVTGLLAAWRLLGRRLEDPPLLLLCGAYGWSTYELRRRVAAAEATGRVRHLGYVTSGQLATLYRSAEVVVFPSLYEGFGLPAIEALAAGTPLVCSDVPALREVAGEAALYAPAERPELLAGQLERVLRDRELRARLAAAGRRRAAGFSWPAAAQRTLEVWREAAGGR